MNVSANFILGVYLLLALPGTTGVSVASFERSTLSAQSNVGGQQAEWQRVNPGGEEFSILTPIAPTLIRLGGNFYFSPGSEQILEHRSYGGSDGDFIFFVESYKAERPQKLAKHLDKRDYPPAVFESEVQLSGFKAKQYRLESPHYHGKRFFVVTKEHAYLITAASKDENSAAVTRFVSSLILGEKITAPATGQAVDVRDTAEYKSAVRGEYDPSPAGQILSSKQVSHMAVIVARPEPKYTEEARQKGVTGTVALRGIFGADGRLRNVKVYQALGRGLDENAIEAALCIRFFPAEKDGKPVSQYIQIEYNFHLY